MKALPKAQRWAAIAAGLLLTTAGQIQACTICMGAADEPKGPALNGAIFFMLGCLGVMFSGIGAVAYSIWRRRHLGTPVA